MVGLLLIGAGLAGCGQRGPLYLPQDAAAQHRATLPDLLTPKLPGTAASGASAPAEPGAAR